VEHDEELVVGYVIRILSSYDTAQTIELIDSSICPAQSYRELQLLVRMFVDLPFYEFVHFVFLLTVFCRW
jgi:hypothetical protein